MNLFENLQIMREVDSSHNYNGKTYYSKEDMLTLYDVFANKINNIDINERMKLQKQFKKYDHSVSFMPKYTKGLNMSNYPTNIYDLIQNKSEQPFLDEDDIWDVIEDLISLNKYLDEVDLNKLEVPQKSTNSKSNSLKDMDVNTIEDLIAKYKFKETDLYVSFYKDGGYDKLSLSTYHLYKDESIIKSYIRKGGIDSLLADKKVNLNKTNVTYSQYLGVINVWKFNNSILNDYIILESSSRVSGTLLFLIKFSDYSNLFTKSIDNNVNDNVYPEYEELADSLKMYNSGLEKTYKFNNVDIKFRSLYSREKMSYGAGFAYDDLFISANREVTKKFKECIGEKIYNKIWQYKNDENILLVSMPNFHYIVTKNMFFEDLENNKKLLNI